MKHRGLFPLDGSDRHNGQKDKRTDKETLLFSSPFIRLFQTPSKTWMDGRTVLDGV